MDFGELKRDVTFVSRVTDFDQSLEEIQEQVTKALEIDPTKLTKEDRIKHELFLCYSTNTLYYLYLKINGVNVNEVSLSSDLVVSEYTPNRIPVYFQHPIKNELSRIRQAMLREKQLEDRAIRPKMNVPVAKRVIRHELWDHKDAKAKKDRS